VSSVGRAGAGARHAARGAPPNDRHLPPASPGLVWRVAGETESEGDPSDDDYSTDSDAGSLPEGGARVTWLQSTAPARARAAAAPAPRRRPPAETPRPVLEDSADLRVVDRGLVSGDVVAAAAAPLGRTGVVVAVRRALTVRLPTGQTVTGVPSTALTPVLPLCADQPVLKDGWLGRVGLAVAALTLRFADGAVADVRPLPDGPTLEESDALAPASMADVCVADDHRCPFYPGQRVVARSVSALHAFRVRVHGGGALRSLRATVVRVWVDEVEIDWRAPVGGAPGSGAPPPEVLKPDGVVPVGAHFFDPAYWHLGTRGLWTGGEEGGEEEDGGADADTSAPAPPARPAGWAATVANGLAAMWPAAGAPAPAAAAPATPRRARAAAAAATPRRAGRRAGGRRPNPAAPEPGAIPVTALVTATATVADVVWQDGETQTGLPARSLLPITHLDDHEFWPDDLVVEAPVDGERGEGRAGVVTSADGTARVARVAWFQRDPATRRLTLPDPASAEPVSVYGIRAHPDWRFAHGDVVVRLGGGGDARARADWRARVGEVVGLASGRVTVAWCGGGSTEEWPDELFTLSRDDDDDGVGEGDGGPPPQPAAPMAWTEGDASSDGGGSAESLASDGEGGDADADADATATATASSPDPPTPADWPAFDMLEGDPPDDFAFAAALRASTAPLPRRFTKAAAREWDALRAGLPAGTAWVRGWEGRLDALRAAVAGPAGTPYAGHIFIFDVHLAPDHPLTPPAVAYHAFGLRVNPNLYECGKVCLSLLGTWAGRADERWDPARSTLLQVVVSVQGLVLVPEPYYNEAGYEKQAGTDEGAKNSRLYSESAFLLCARTARALLARPPAGFGGLVRSHYRATRGGLLAAAEACAAGEAAVGHAWGGDAASAPPTGEPPALPSQGFQLAMRALMPRFREALESV